MGTNPTVVCSKIGTNPTYPSTGPPTSHVHTRTPTHHSPATHVPLACTDLRIYTHHSTPYSSVYVYIYEFNVYIYTCINNMNTQSIVGYPVYCGTVPACILLQNMPLNVAASFFLDAAIWALHSASALAILLSSGAAAAAACKSTNARSKSLPLARCACPRLKMPANQRTRHRNRTQNARTPACTHNLY